MGITEKNHYNPCFWTAYWNFDYLSNKRKGEQKKDKAREQQIFSLNLKSNKVLQLKTQNAFVDKGAGLAVITKDDALDFCKRMHPESYQELYEYYRTDSSELTLDFENHFSGIENQYKDHLERAIISESINTIEDKFFLSFFLVTQLLRNHNHLQETISLFKSNGKKKFEMFLNLKHALSNQNEVRKWVEPYLFSKWKLYKTSSFKFPLSDNSVLLRPFHVFLPLAPDLLLEIDLKKKVSEKNVCTTSKGLPFWKYAKFRKRTIENSSREIVYGEENLLVKWQSSKLYKRQLEML